MPAIVIALLLLGLSAVRGNPAPPSGVRDAAERAGFGAYADRIAAAARPTVFLGTGRAGQPSALGTSRMGGEPDLPRGSAWPRCKGRKQSFMAQVRVKDLPRSARELRRAGGLLLFFTDVELEPGEREHGLWAGDCTTVLHARAGARLERALRQTGPVLRLRPAALRFLARPDVPDLGLDSDALMPPLRDIVPPGGYEPWSDFRSGIHDTSLESKLLGYPVAPNGGDACWARAERSRGTWRHLFTIGPDDGTGFEVADAGRLQVLISPADLRAGRFDRVCGVFDSA
jgi:hypothetical protein